MRPNDRVKVEVGLSPRLGQWHVGLHLLRQRLGNGDDDTGRREDGRESSLARSVDEGGDDCKNEGTFRSVHRDFLQGSRS